MIPKKIHYCWFGGNPKSETIEKCINSWKKKCPDYEIIEWNENNWDITKYTFSKEAYEAQKWAFVSDIARLDIVYNNGGIYLDTDVELYNSLDDFLSFDAFFSFETGRFINSGGGFGARKEHVSLKAMMRYYSEKNYIINGKATNPLCPFINTEAIKRIYPSFKQNGQKQIVDNVMFISVSDYSKYMKHYELGGWDGNNHGKGDKKFKETRLKGWLRKPVHYEIIEKKLGNKALRIYEFLTYDLIEYGILYYFNRFLRANK